jgi:hypothetical protein
MKPIIAGTLATARPSVRAAKKRPLTGIQSSPASPDGRTVHRWHRMRNRRSDDRLTLLRSRQYSRIAMSKCQLRRISTTSNSRASAGGNAW